MRSMAFNFLRVANGTELFAHIVSHTTYHHFHHHQFVHEAFFDNIVAFLFCSILILFIGLDIF